MHLHRVLTAILVFVGATIHSAIATSADPSNFAETDYLTNSLVRPTGMAWAPDGSGRLFVATKGHYNPTTSTNFPAEIRIVQHNPATNRGSLLPTVFASFNSYTVGQSAPATDPVWVDRECGLVGICLDPDFLSNHYVYVFVTVSTSEQQIIRFTDTAGVGTNKTVIVAALPTNGTNHNGGGVGIGYDGKLYWSIGDRSNNTGVDDDLAALAAKVGRANRFTGAACNDNPFFDGAGPNADHIWARGFRNPFSLTFQPGTGKLWVNVVGSSPNGDTQPNSGPGYEQAFTVTRGAHVGWNNWENNQPAGFLPPVIAYRVNSTTASTIAPTGAARNSDVITFTTTAFHPFRQGAKVTIAGVGSASFNGTFDVLARISDTQFTVAHVGVNEVSGGGTATTQAIGGSITGGTFYDSTAYPAPYRGNFFFGDVVTGNIMRTTLDANDVPTSINPFVTGFIPQVDSATGPDGAVYFVQHDDGGRIRRLATTSTAQNIIVHPTAFPVVEGSSAIVSVRLAQMPASDVTVNVAKTGGDANVNVSSGSSLVFTTANWNQFQTATITAAEDADLDAGSASFDVGAAGIATYSVTATEIENDDPLLVISRANLAITETSNGTFTVALAAAPTGPVTVNVMRTSGDTDVTVSSGAVLNFNSGNFATPQTVTIAAANDADIVADTATITITLDSEPVRTVNISVTDNDNAPPLITTTADTTAAVNSPYEYDVDATGNPAPQFTLTTFPSGMTINLTTGVITWTPTSTGTFPVTVRANNNVNPASTQSFNLVVNPDGAPFAVLTQPFSNDVLSGTSAEFFGDGLDDVTCVKAEFFVDGTLRYTDVNSIGHYHYAGSHVLFDTTVFTNGPHTLRFTVTDTIGQTAFQEASVFIGNGVNAWRTQQFSVGEQSDPLISDILADADGDGLANLLEYAMHLGPKTPNTGVPAIQRQLIGSDQYLTLTFVRVKWATDIVYRVECTDDLNGAWTSIDALLPANQVSVQDDAPSAGLQTITVKDVVPATVESRFMRLNVTLP